MIIILKSDARKQQIEALKEEMVSQGFAIHESAGINTQLLGLIGDTSKVDVDHVMANDIVETVQRIRNHTRRQTGSFTRMTRL